MIQLLPHSIYTAAEAGKILGKGKRTIQRIARRLNKSKGCGGLYFSVEELREVLGVK